MWFGTIQVLILNAANSLGEGSGCFQAIFFSAMRCRLVEARDLCCVLTCCRATPRCWAPPLRELRTGIAAFLCLALVPFSQVGHVSTDVFEGFGRSFEASLPVLEAFE